MKTLNFDLLSENILSVSELFNVRGGDGDENEGETNTSATTTTTVVDIIL